MASYVCRQSRFQSEQTFCGVHRPALVPTSSMAGILHGGRVGRFLARRATACHDYPLQLEALQRLHFCSVFLTQENPTNKKAVLTRTAWRGPGRTRTAE